MTLDEAIERNITTKDELWQKGFPTHATAVGLGNEALNRLRAIRKSDNNECFNCIKPLPGESR